MEKELVDDITKAEELVAEIEAGGRHSITGWGKKLIGFVAAGWSIFQLLLPQFLLLDSVVVRSIHLAFAITLVYLSHSAFKKNGLLGKRIIDSNNRFFKFLVHDSSIHFIDIILSLMAAASALYLAYDYVGIGSRQGFPNTTDLIMGIGLIVLLLEAARRSLGFALPTISLTFILYSFFSEYAPSIISFQNATINKVINKMTMGSEGIYGIPLYVSASTVFLFVLFGSILERAGGGKYFIDLAFSLLGRYRGGPAKAAVLASGLTGMASGSSIANTVTTGTFTIPLMKKSGYSGIKAGAIEVAASTNGQLMPPIMGAAAFIIAEYCGLSYLEVVKAAFIPAISSYLALIYITHLEALKLDLKGLSKDKLPHFWRTLKSGFHFLIPLAFLFYQLIIARHSAQLAVYYSILILVALIFIRNIYDGQKNNEHTVMSSIKFSAWEVWEALISGGKNMMSIGVAVASAGIIVGIVTLGLGNVIVDLIDLVASGNLILLLLITAVISLILGMGLPTTANYIVMATLTVPAIVKLSGTMGLEAPLIAAHLFCFYFGILADVTPPVGLAAYAAAAISKEDPIKTGIQGFIYSIRTAILPFMFIFNTDIILQGVNSWGHIILVFVCCVVAMFSFTSILQGYFVRKNRIYEAAILFIVCAFLFRPYYFSGLLEIPKNMIYAIGLGSYVLLYLWQKKSLKTPLREALPS